MSAVDATAVEIAPAEPGEGETEARAAGGAARSLSGEKAKRIIDAMRSSVARRGTAGSTFDHVSREAGVSRGLLHYYFGTKEQLLVEAVRRDCELRMERLESRLSKAKTADDFIDLMAQDLRQTVRDEPDMITLIFELFTLSRHNTDIAAEYAALMRRTREQVAGMLAVAGREGVLHLHAEPEAVAEVLFALADGFALRMLAEPERDFTPSIRAAITCVRALLSD
jgi:AcrR family transcriptional regulator